MESEFYRRALIRNFFASLFKEGEGYLERVREEDVVRVCTTEDQELKELAETAAEFVAGIKVSEDEVMKRLTSVREWCQSLRPS